VLFPGQGYSPFTIEIHSCRGNNVTVVTKTGIAIIAPSARKLTSRTGYIAKIAGICGAQDSRFNINKRLCTRAIKIKGAKARLLTFFGSGEQFGQKTGRIIRMSARMGQHFRS